MKDIITLKKDLLEAIKSDPEAMDKIPDIIEVAIKRVADIKEEEIHKLEQEKEELEDKLKKEQEEPEDEKEKEEVKEQAEKEKEEEEDEMKEAKARYFDLTREITKLEQEEKDEEEEKVEEQVKGKEKEVAPEEGHDSDVTPPDEARDVGKQPADEGEEEDHPKISRATGKLEAARAELKKLEQKLALPGLVDPKEKEVDPETGKDPNVKESELEEAVKIAYKKGQESTVEEITKSSTIGQALMAFEKIKEAVFPLIKEDINVEGFEGNVYNLLKEKEKSLEQAEEEKEKAEKEKGEMEETMGLINQKLKNLKEEIEKEKELEDKVKEVVETIDDPGIKEKALEAAKSVKPEDFDTFKILVETFKSGQVSEEKEDKILIESKEENLEESTKTDQEKINMMKKLAGIKSS